MHQPSQATAQAVADLAQRIGACQLTKQHGDELRPAGKAFGGMLSGVLLYECGELGAGKVLEQLIEQARELYDWVALLWAAFGEVPARSGSPTSIIGGRSSYFRLQEPVLDKSEWEQPSRIHGECCFCGSVDAFCKCRIWRFQLHWSVVKWQDDGCSGGDQRNVEQEVHAKLAGHLEWTRGHCRTVQSRLTSAR